MVKLFIRLDRLLSSPSLFLTGEAPLEERCRPAFIVAAAAKEERVGERGEGGLLRKASELVMEMLRGGAVCGGVEAEGGREFRSGGILCHCCVCKSER